METAASRKPVFSCMGWDTKLALLFSKGTIMCSSHFQLGQSAFIDIKEGEKKRAQNGKESQTWEASYNVEGLTGAIFMTKTTGRNSREELLEISIEDNLNREKTNDDVVRIYSIFEQ
ncbi:hypothetical protein JHK85_026226 [Glycine max]|nr:hypothetical protein JHK85_026226 [Glycine max]